MKTVHKLILKAYAGPMVLTFFIVMFVLVMQFMWRYIDELVGKGLSVDVVLELLMYAAATLIPMGLPLATLLAAIMTMGNMGENYELLALKSAGMSLPRIMKPLTILIVFVSIGSFFVANNLVPYSSKKIYSILYDIRQQKQTLEFKDGIFFNGIENMSIRVGRQDPKTKLLEDVLIYDTRKLNGDMTTTVADSGYISLSDDKKFLLVTLYSGETYEEARNYNWATNSTMRHHIFDVQKGVIPLSGFDMERSNSEMFNNSQTKNVVELQSGIDSLENVVDASFTSSYEPLLRNYIFTYNTTLAQDTIPAQIKQDNKVLLTDSLVSLSLKDKKSLWSVALNNTKSSKSYYSFDEETSKAALAQLYKYRIEWNRKFSLPVSIFIFFLIGAPLGAIIRKGGLGMPIVISVIFFVIYYIISITGEKMAREGTWNAFSGMWISSFILLPISVFLTYKATHDSNLFNTDWYYNHFKKLLDRLKLKKNKK